MRVISSLAAGVALLLLPTGASVAQTPEQPRWVPSWHAVPNEPSTTPHNTIRTLVRLTTGGTSVRVRLSNVTGTTPVSVSKVTVALSSGGPNVHEGTLREARFDNDRATTIRPRGDVFTDAISMPVQDNAMLLVTTYTPAGTPCQARAHRTNYVAFGDHADDLTGAAFTGTITSVCLASRVEVTSDRDATVAYGDSITEGESTSWPGYANFLNSGISGNGLVAAPEPMTARLYRDALYSPQIRTVVLFGGINDIQQGVQAEALIAGVTSIRIRTQREGVRLIVGTVTPWQGWSAYTPQRELQRQRLNAFIRTLDHVDFDEVVRDPANPLRLRPEFDLGDHLHPNDAAFRAMADALQR